MSDIIKIATPLDDETIKSLKAGQLVHLSGTIYTARDAAHKKIVEAIKNNKVQNSEIAGKAVYYAGPCPSRPGHNIGSIGPTTSGRMDAYTPFLMERGLKVTIGKGVRSKEVKDAIVKHNGLYFAAIGGAGAVIAKCVTAVETIAFDELGPEAIRKLTVENLPLIVAVDSHGNDIYEMGIEKYKSVQQ